MKEAAARIKVNHLLEAAGWRFFTDDNGVRSKNWIELFDLENMADSNEFELRLGRLSYGSESGMMAFSE